jgi:lipopolysaccharide/colanic/teichoic acid biosynthesis glycosyltransferase
MIFVALALPILAGLCLALLVLNPFFNSGPLFFRQERMGLGSTRFTIWKFRTMSPAPAKGRHPDAPVERRRITPLGFFLRRSRLDELPNIFNIISGDMTLVGPRPDIWEHAEDYSKTIPYYRDRVRVKPGITGLAQVRLGYADNRNAVKRKARYDRLYVRRSHGRLDVRILWETIVTVFSGSGAK